MRRLVLVLTLVAFVEYRCSARWPRRLRQAPAVPTSPTLPARLIGRKVPSFGLVRTNKACPAVTMLMCAWLTRPRPLQVHVLVVDYYLWYNEDPQPNHDLTQYDAVTLYLDTHHDRMATPQSDDYYFLSALHLYPVEDAPEYRRQARGTGSGWNTAWSGSWTDTVAMAVE